MKEGANDPREIMVQSRNQAKKWQKPPRNGLKYTMRAISAQVENLD